MTWVTGIRILNADYETVQKIMTQVEEDEGVIFSWKVSFDIDNYAWNQWKNDFYFVFKNEELINMGNTVVDDTFNWVMSYLTSISKKYEVPVIFRLFRPRKTHEYYFIGTEDMLWDFTEYQRDNMMGKIIY